MASYFYGINRGDPMYKAVVQSSTTGKETEITINTNLDRATAMTQIQFLIDFMIQNNYPPL